jgi:hypothetical protein
VRIEERGSGWWLGPSSFLDPPPSLLSRRSSFLRPPSSVLSPIDIDPEYCRMALRRLDSEAGPLFARAAIKFRTATDFLTPATAVALADAPRRQKQAGRRR